MTIRLINWPVRVKICIRERSFPRSQTTILPDCRMTATLRGYQSCPSSLPGVPKSCLNKPSLSKIWKKQIKLKKTERNFWKVEVNLDAVIVGVGHDNIFVDSQTESMRRIELAFSRTQLSESNSSLHRNVLWIRCQRSATAAARQSSPR